MGLGLLLLVSFLDFGRGGYACWAYDLSAAKTALKNKDYSKVIDLLSPEVENLDREGLFALAKAYSSQKKSAAAIKAYTAALALNSKDVEAKTLIGAELFVSGKEKESVNMLKEALEINPKFVPAFKVLIRVYEKRKNKYELRLLYQDLVDKVGEKAEYITKLCELSTADGLYDLSKKYCARGIELSPEEPSNYVHLGTTLKETGNIKEAESNLKKAADDFQKSVLSLMTYAKFLDDQKNYILSYTYYKKAVEVASKDTAPLLGLANATLEIQKYQESLEAYLKACKMDKASIANFRRSTNVLRTMKLETWLRKFESALDECESSAKDF